MRSDYEASRTKNSMTFVPVGLNGHRPNINPPILGFRRCYIYVCLLSILVVLILIARAISSARVIFVEFHTESDTDGELLILPRKYAEEKGAFCLDGSPPGYYIRMGNPHVNSWIIHLQPGAWCSTEQECYRRSFTALGSTAKAPVSSVFRGILSSDKVENPDFYMWNMVEFVYCDGSSFTGTRKSPVNFMEKKLYFRGHLILSALIDYLLEHTNIKTADQVILAGSSAGGLAALLNVDFVRRKLNSVKLVHAVLDGMLFLDYPTKSGQHLMQTILKDMFYLHHSHEAESIQKCTSNLSVTDQWQCVLPTHFYSHIYTPVFIISSAYDTWFLRRALEVTCPLSSCPQETAILIEEFKAGIMKAIKPVIFSVHDGIFLTSCPIHVSIVTPLYNSKIMVNSLTIQQAIGQWYFQRQPQDYKYIEQSNLTQVLNKCPTQH